MKYSRKLLINPAIVFYVEDRGITWVTDRYILMRADLLKNPPSDQPAKDRYKIANPVTVKTVRDILEMAREQQIAGTVRDTGQTVQVGAFGETPAAQLVGVQGRTLTAVNAATWAAWAVTDCVPTMTTRGMCTWWRDVRGKRALHAVMMPVVAHLRLHAKDAP